jgi:hypothetical protein
MLLHPEPYVVYRRNFSFSLQYLLDIEIGQVDSVSKDIQNLQAHALFFTIVVMDHDKMNITNRKKSPDWAQRP